VSVFAFPDPHCCEKVQGCFLYEQDRGKPPKKRLNVTCGAARERARGANSKDREIVTVKNRGVVIMKLIYRAL
jgi:hypothetical protein